MIGHPRPGSAAPIAAGRLSWQKLAACKGDLDPFFGPDDAEPAPDRKHREARAKSVCAGCPVRWKCGSFAIAEGIRFGVWGGFGEDELARERNRYLRRQRSYATEEDVA